MLKMSNNIDLENLIPVKFLKRSLITFFCTNITYVAMVFLCNVSTNMNGISTIHET